MLIEESTGGARGTLFNGLLESRFAADRSKFPFARGQAIEKGEARNQDSRQPASTVRKFVDRSASTHSPGSRTETCISRVSSDRHLKGICDEHC
jgi:hypothetical protein